MHFMSHRGSSRLARVIPSMHGHLCVVWWLFSSPVSFSSPFRCSSSRPSRCPSSEFHEKFMSKDLRDFRLGTVASNDHETPPHRKRGSLNKTYKCHTEANDKVWDLNRKTERALRRCRCYTRGSIRLTANLQR